MQEGIAEEAEQVADREQHTELLSVATGVGPEDQHHHHPEERCEADQAGLGHSLQVLVVEVGKPRHERSQLRVALVQQLAKTAHGGPDAGADQWTLADHVESDNGSRDPLALVGVVAPFDRHRLELAHRTEDPGAERLDRERRRAEDEHRAHQPGRGRRPRPVAQDHRGEDHCRSHERHLPGAADVDQKAADHEGQQRGPRQPLAGAMSFFEQAGQRDQAGDREHHAVVEMGHGRGGVAGIGVAEPE